MTSPAFSTTPPVPPGAGDLPPGAAARVAEFAPRMRAAAFDVDGTLTDADHHVSAGNLAALRRLDAAGMPVVVVTGRSLAAAAATLLRADLHGYVASCNGALIVDLATNEVVWERPLGAEAASAVIDLAARTGVTCTLFTRDEVLLSQAGPGGAHLAFMRVANTGTNVEVSDLATVPPGDVLKILLAADPDVLDALDPQIGRVAPAPERSLDDWSEICHPEANKWAALTEILGRLDIDAADVAGAGDGGNDVSWMAHIGLSAAMANARPELKDVCDIEIGHHLDDAVAAFVDALLEARR